MDQQVDMKIAEKENLFDFEGALPLRRKNTMFENETGNMSAGIWESLAMTGKMRPFPIHEFVLMLEGAVTIAEENGAIQTFATEDCSFIPKGTICSWKIESYAKFYFAHLDVGSREQKAQPGEQAVRCSVSLNASSNGL